MDEQKAYSLLSSSEKFFTPPLSTEIDLSTYAGKLGKHAHFIACIYNEDIIGYTAFYCNDHARQLYIPLICVSEAHRQEGLGSQMLKRLADTYNNRYYTIALEVVKENTKAYNFYIKQGFKIQEDRGKKFLMVKAI